MGKSRDFRGPRRRGFDDDQYYGGGDDSRRGGGGGGFGGGFSGGGFAGGGAGGGFNSRPRPMPEGPVVAATVKWFNGEKGFGFVALADGSGDAFLHAGVLQASGHESVSPGATLQVQVGQGAKGPQVTRVAEVDESTAQPAARGPRPGGPGGPGGFAGGGARGPRVQPDLSTAVEVGGVVKWFNTEKGFGFVTGEDGGRDVFVHISVLTRANLPSLAEGQRVAMRVVETPKGREAVSLSLAD